jgi:hypothetical protein
MDLGKNDQPPQGLVIVSFFIPLICLKLAPWLTYRKASSESITLVPELPRVLIFMNSGKHGRYFISAHL